MDTLYLLQFACFLFMLMNILLILGITRSHMKWMNRRYELSRWLILGAIGLASQIHADALGLPGARRFRGSRFQHAGLLLASHSSLSAFTISRQTHANRRKMNIVCASIYAAILAALGIGYIQSGNFHIGSWIYVMIVLFGINVAYRCCRFRL